MQGVSIFWVIDNHRDGEHRSSDMQPPTSPCLSAPPIPRSLAEPAGASGLNPCFVADTRTLAPNPAPVLNACLIAGLVMKFFFRSQEIALPAPKREMMMFEHPDPPPGELCHLTRPSSVFLEPSSVELSSSRRVSSDLLWFARLLHRPCRIVRRESEHATPASEGSSFHGVLNARRRRTPLWR